VFSNNTFDAQRALAIVNDEQMPLAVACLMLIGMREYAQHPVVSAEAPQRMREAKMALLYDHKWLVDFFDTQCAVVPLSVVRRADFLHAYTTYVHTRHGSQNAVLDATTTYNRLRKLLALCRAQRTTELVHVTVCDNGDLTHLRVLA
jgi:hypothetical protein